MKIFKIFINASFIQKSKTIIFTFAVLVGLALFLSPENLAFYGVAPHPYLVTGVILSLIYGFNFSVNYSIISSLLYLYLLHLQTDYTVVESLLRLEYLSLPIVSSLLFVIVGEIGTRSQQRLKDHQKRESELSLTVSTINSKMLNLHGEALDLKKQLITKLETFKSTLKLTSGFQSFKRDEVSTFYFDTLKDELGFTKAVYYEKVKDSYILKHAVSALDHLLQIELTDNSQLSQLLMKKRLVAVNRDFSADESEYLFVMPIMINEELEAFLLVYEMPFLNLTPNNLGIVEILTEWLTRSLNYSRKYYQIQSNSVFDTELDIYTYPYIKERLHKDFVSSKRYNYPLYMIKIQIEPNSAGFDKRRIVAANLRTLCRTSDIIASGAELSEILIVFGFITESQAYRFLAKVEKSFQDILPENFGPLKCSLTVIHQLETIEGVLL